MSIPLAACGGDPAPPVDEFEGPAASERSTDPRAAEARRALEEGRPTAARPLIEALGRSLGAEGGCLRARMVALEGDLVEARRELEAVRALGVLAVASPGQGRLGLQLLEEARRGDPRLPFCDVPLSRAHLLVAREELGRAEVAPAAEHVDAALALFPTDPAARESLAEVRLAQKRFGEARDLYEELHAEGIPIREPLLEATRLAATEAMLAGDRGAQVDCYVRMRELGVPPDQLGFGRTVLRQEARKLIDRAVESYDLADRLRSDAQSSAAVRDEMARLRAEELELAEQLLVAAIGFDPGSPEAHHRLGETLFQLGSFERAALEWEAVLDLSAGEDLGTGVHLNAARAWRAGGNLDRAREVCERYLVDAPNGDWADATREMLGRL